MPRFFLRHSYPAGTVKGKGTMIKSVCFTSSMDFVTKNRAGTFSWMCLTFSLTSSTFKRRFLASHSEQLVGAFESIRYTRYSRKNGFFINYQRYYFHGGLCID